MKSKLMLVAFLVLALVIRMYRLDELLGFYYDQGRDAKVIWDLWHQGRLFLIGPTTGIEGIFRGPWYYWLIAPWYLLGNGNPVVPAAFLVVLSVAAIWWLYYLAYQLSGQKAGLVALVLAVFSSSLVGDARWLSNPTPMLFISMLTVQSIVWIINNRQSGWLWAGVGLGMAMQFGSAAEVFYFPAFAALLLEKRKNLQWKWVAGGIGAILISFFPQVVFDGRHQGVLRNAVWNFLITERGFGLGFWQTAETRLPFYVSTFAGKIFPRLDFWLWILGGGLVGGLVFGWKKLSREGKYVLLLFVSPLVGMLFFQGNEGNVYGYYFTGYFMVFVLLLSLLLSNISSSFLGETLLIAVLTGFMYQNVPALFRQLTVSVNQVGHIVLANQLAAIDWIYGKSNGQEFNIDVYVPPVIPHAYDYLFLWLGETKYGHHPAKELKPVLFTIYEEDPPHPQRLEVWLKRQREIGDVEERLELRGITVDKSRRVRWE